MGPRALVLALLPTAVAVYAKFTHDESAACYASRYPELRDLYCKNGSCDTRGLHHHYADLGRAENRIWGCHFVSASNCTKWFVDIGSGYGVASEIFLKNNPKNWSFSTASYPTNGKKNPQHRTGAEQLAYDYKARGFDEISDTLGLHPEEYCFAGLEGNPVFKDKLAEREKEFARRGIYAKFVVPGAIADKDGEVTFFLDTTNVNVNFWGSSLIDYQRGHDAKKTPVTVPAYSFASLFENIGIKPSDAVILHMNAEGGEFYSIPQAVRDGTLCKYVNFLTIDIHYKLAAKGVKTFSRQKLLEWTRACDVRTYIW